MIFVDHAIALRYLSNVTKSITWCVSFALDKHLVLKKVSIYFAIDVIKPHVFLKKFCMLGLIL